MFRCGKCWLRMMIPPHCGRMNALEEVGWPSSSRMYSGSCCFEGMNTTKWRTGSLDTADAT